MTKLDNIMTTQDKLIKTKLGLLQLAVQLKNVSQACRTLGYSRDSYYRIKDLYDSGGEAALQELSRSKPNRKNRVDPHIEEQVKEIAFEYPAYGQLRASNELIKRVYKSLQEACVVYGCAMIWRPSKNVSNP